MSCFAELIPELRIAVVCFRYCEAAEATFAVIPIPMRGQGGSDPDPV